MRRKRPGRSVALLNGDKDSWAVLRDEWKSVIDEVIDGYNNQ
ncbi:hypothetical protein [Ruminococcus sp.]